MKIKEMFQQNKLFQILTGIIAAIVILIIVIVVIMLAQGGRVANYSALEAKLVSAAKSYYQANSNKLPSEIGGKAEVDSTTLSSEKYIKDLSKISPKNSTCSGRVVVKNVNSSYLYQAFVNCEDAYRTTTLSEYIGSHVSTVSIGAGLYSNNGTLIYRGEDPNNYIEFAGRIYRIVQVNSDGTIDIIATEKRDRVVWDDRYNQERNNNEGINDYSVSRVRDTLLAHVNSNAFTDKERSLMEPQTLCIGKVSTDAEVSLGMECGTTLENQVIGLLPISSYIYASLDATCKTPIDGTCENYNYLETNYNWWSLTADESNTYRAYSIMASGSAMESRAASTAVAREVLRLTENTIYVSGDGSEANPFVIK